MVQKKSSITLSQAFEGMILSKQAEGKSVNTISILRIYCFSRPETNLELINGQGQSLLVGNYYRL